MASKMAELKFEAPLAQFEETDEWGTVEFQSNTTMKQPPTDDNNSYNILNYNNMKLKDNNIMLTNNMQNNIINNTKINLTNNAGDLEDVCDVIIDGVEKLLINDNEILQENEKNNQMLNSSSINNIVSGVGGGGAGDGVSEADNFTETFSGSLEDLVNTFDDKITKCFGNYEESVEQLAPVQIRTQEEIMNECQ